VTKRKASTKPAPVQQPGRAVYHPGRLPDNAKAIANGDLHVLVDYLRELASTCAIVWDDDPQKRTALNPPELRKARALDRDVLAMDAAIYAEALAEFLKPKASNRPRELFTMSEALRAIEAAQEYRRLKGKRPAALLEKQLLRRYGIPRANLRAALKGTLPPSELPGIPSADK